MIKDILKVNDFSIIVSLPVNSMEYVIASVEAGAKIIKVHINAFHNATKQKFGTYLEEKSFLEKLATYAAENGVHIGIVPGDLANFASETEMEELRQMGYDFFSSYIQNTPVFMNRITGLERVIAVGKNFELALVKELEMFGADILEASIMDASEYGKALSLYDLLRIKEIVGETKLPVIVPTQKYITKEDMIFLHEVGVKCLMIGAVVYQNQGIESFKRTVEGYINEVNIICSKH